MSKKAAIQRAALELFVEQGIDATTTKQIAARANTSEGNIYRHFSSKDALAETLFFDHLLPFLEALDVAVSSREHMRDRLAEVVRIFYRTFDEDRVTFSYLLLSQHQHLAKFTESAETPVTFIHRLVQHAVAGGEIRPLEPMIATGTILGTILQPATFVVYGRLDPPLIDYAETVVDTIWRALAPD
ncbi:MAG: TetR/AcrR family transcriptional regulator [Azospirillaceae bacterium]